MYLLRNFLFISFIALPLLRVNAQLVYSASSHNFGEINSKDNTYFDFKLTNLSDKPSQYLRFDPIYAVDVKVSKTTIEPDSSIIVRIKYSPKRKGTFKTDVPIWFSSNNKPIIFTLKGKALSINRKASIECPDFNTKKNKDKALTRNLLTLLVVDQSSGLPIPNASVDIMWGGLQYKSLTTNRKGEAKTQTGIYKYGFVTKSEGYQTSYKEYFISNNSNLITIALSKEKALTSKKPFDWEEQSTAPSIKPAKSNFKKNVVITSQLLPENQFKPNHIVFLIDNSVSMKKKDRLNLLKLSIIELLEQLRSIDKLSIVTYASDTKTLLSGENVNDKTVITSIINSIQAAGTTNGNKGISKALQLSKVHFIPNGNNQIIAATDGAFEIKKYSPTYQKLKLSTKKGIRLSVVGIKNNDLAEKTMRHLSSVGKGSFMSIHSKQDAKSLLIKEIQNNSKLF